MAEQCSHYWHNDQCVLCEEWEPQEADRIISVWIVAMDGRRCVFDDEPNALEALAILRAEGGDPTLTQSTMKRVEYASAPEFEGW